MTSKHIAVRALLVLTLVGMTSLLSPAQVKVHIADGDLEGTTNSSTVVFKGIPYATPPVGDRRWTSPTPPAPWTGIRKATESSAACIQDVVNENLPWTKEFMVHGATSEDCLYLNVWAPINFKGKALPVYVYIHGGGFNQGSGAVTLYDGANLAGNGIVVVTINYRLGALGFMAHPELTAESAQHASGNYGLMDAIASLHWVRDNIAVFGGDPQEVSIGGQSAGAAMVHDLCASALSKGLFRGAEIASGTWLSPPMKKLQVAENDGVAYAKSKGVQTLADLRKLPSNSFIIGPKEGVPFSPIVDGFILPDDPITLTQEGKANNVALLVGLDADEGSAFGSYGHLSAEQWHKQAEDRYATLAGKFETLYPAADDTAASQVQKISARDRGQAATYLWCLMAARKMSAPIYTYYFNEPIPWPAHPEFGVFHSSDLAYVFRNLDKMDRPFTAIDRRVEEQMSEYSLNFIKTGNPNNPKLPEWKALLTNDPMTMEIAGSSRTRPLMSHEKFSFWDEYFSSPQGKQAPMF